jgi:hypothetical protein
MEQLRSLNPRQIRALTLDQLQLILTNSKKDKIGELKALIVQLDYDYTISVFDTNTQTKRTKNKILVPQILKNVYNDNNSHYYIMIKNKSELRCFTKDEMLQIIPEDILNKILVKIDDSNKFDLDWVTSLCSKTNNLHIISTELLKSYNYFQSDPELIDDFINNL